MKELTVDKSKHEPGYSKQIPINDVFEEYLAFAKTSRFSQIHQSLRHN